MDQQLLMEASQLEKYTSELEQHEEYIAQQITELTQFAEQLHEISKSSEKKLLSSIGKRVYLQTEVTDKKLFVEVGAGVIVRKTPEELHEVIVEQLAQLRESQKKITTQRSFYTQKLHELMHMLEQQHASMTA